MAKESKSAAKNTSAPKQDEGKVKALNLAMEQITKQFGDGSIMKLGDAKKVDVELLSSGMPLLRFKSRAVQRLLLMPSMLLILLTRVN